MAKVKSGPLSDEFREYRDNLRQSMQEAQKGKVGRKNLYTRSNSMEPEKQDNRNALQKRRESMVPQRVLANARKDSNRAGYYNRENEAAIGATKEDFKANSGKATMNIIQRKANEQKRKK